MNSQQIRIFLNVASCRSFSAAGERLFLSQSVISYHIRSFEKELGFRVFDRDTHSVALTPAGQSLYRSLGDISLRTAEAIETAKRLAFRNDASLRICFANPTSPTMMGQIVNRIYNILQAEKIELIKRSYDDVLQPLIYGTADIIFTYPHFFREDQGFSMKHFCRVWTSCLVSKAHPLSQKKSLCLSDLRNQRLLFPDCRNIRIEYGQVYRNITAGTVSMPVIDATPQTFEQVQGLAMAGRGVMLIRTMDDMYHDNIDGLVSIPLRDIESEYLVVIWDPETICTNGKEFIEKIRADDRIQC